MAHNFTDNKSQKQLNPFEIEEDISEILPAENATIVSIKSALRNNPITPERSHIQGENGERSGENSQNFGKGEDFHRKKRGKPQSRMNNIENMTRSMLK